MSVSAQMPRYVNGHQFALDDASLATFGYDRETFERARLQRAARAAPPETRI